MKNSRTYTCKIREAAKRWKCKSVSWKQEGFCYCFQRLYKSDRPAQSDKFSGCYNLSCGDWAKPKSYDLKARVILMVYNSWWLDQSRMTSVLPLAKRSTSMWHVLQYRFSAFPVQLKCCVWKHKSRQCPQLRLRQWLRSFQRMSQLRTRLLVVFSGSLPYGLRTTSCILHWSLNK